MARLSEADYRKALGVLYAAGEVESAIPFPKPVLRALQELVPCDVVTFHEHTNNPGHVLVYTGDPVGEMTPEIRASHRRLEHEDPFRPADGPRALSDFVSHRVFRRTAFYAEVHRPLGIEHMLQLYLDPRRSDARLEFDRAETDFSERDRRVLTLLLPHLRQVLRSAPRRSSLTAREREILGHVADGRTNGEVAAMLGISSHTVRKHLENTYAKLQVHTRTAAVAAVARRRRG
jgi:DNA-binding CsgD family transcriptional regulator